MKRFILFGGNFYYPSGGGDDFIEAFDEFPDRAGLIARLSDVRDGSGCWAHVFDMATRRVVLILDGHWKGGEMVWSVRAPSEEEQ